MNTKVKLLSHVDHILSSRLTNAELDSKMESLEVMADWALKQNQITQMEYKEIRDKIKEGKKEKVADGNNNQKITTESTKKTMPILKKIRSILLNKKIFIIIILIVLTSIGSGIFFISYSKKSISLINPTNVKKEGRFLRFQGTIIDGAGKPIDRKVDVNFHLYAQKIDGKPVYTGACTGESGLVPGLDGSFSISIGSDCDMKPIPNSVFSNNQGLYLGVQVGNEKELLPRYPIATVQYASNSEKVKGLTLGTNESSIPYIDEQGRLVIAAVSPKLKSTRGEFSIEGETVSISTNEDSGGSINLKPSDGGNVIIESGKVGIGKKNPISQLDVQGSIGLTDDLVFNGENTSIYQNQGGSILFYTAKEVSDLTSPALLLASENKIGLVTNKIVDTISAGGSMSPSDDSKFNLGTQTNKWKTIYANELILASEGVGGFWQRQGDKISPAVLNEDVILGSHTEQNALIKLAGKSNSPSWINSGNLGIGTSTPHSLLSGISSVDNNSLISFTNLNKKDTNGTNVLRLGLGVSSAGTSASFVDFYAGTTNDNNGTKVGSIRIQNGGVVYQTAGADFAEYIDLDETADEGDIIGISASGKHKALNTDTSLIGVVSTIAGFIGNAKEEGMYKNKTIVGLIGQLKTNVSTINGTMKQGNYITSSSIPGYGSLAINSGQVIGTVMDSQLEINKNLTSKNCPEKYQNANLKCGKIKILLSPKQVLLPEQTYKKSFTTKGTATIQAGETLYRIYNTNITESSSILLTPIYYTSVNLTIKDQHLCKSEDTCKPYFEVILNKPLRESLKFNWLIVN